MRYHGMHASGTKNSLFYESNMHACAVLPLDSSLSLVYSTVVCVYSFATRMAFLNNLVYF